MLVNFENVEFPAVMKLSFRLLLESLEKRVLTARAAESKYLKELLSRAAEFPELVTGVDESKIESYREIIDDLFATIFPYALKDNEIKGASAPWKFDPFYFSDRLKTIIAGAGGGDSWKHFEIDEDSYYVAACSAILAMHYGWPIHVARPFFVDLKNGDSNWVRTYRVGINADFMKLEPTALAPEITLEDYHELIDNFNDIELWKRKFPPGSWVFSGFTIFSMMDLTHDERIRRIGNDLLSGDRNGFMSIRKNLSDLLEIEDLKVSFINIKNRDFYRLDANTGDSMMMGGETQMSAKDLLCEYSFHELLEGGRPFALPDVDRYIEMSDSPLADNLKKAAVRSFFATPISFEGELLGVLELGAESKGILNATTQILMERVLPVLAIAGNRMLGELRNRVEAIIQEECTTIHPSVKWRFAEEALESIKAEDKKGPYIWKDITFKDVYPLYGQLDIRNSSSIRNEAIRSDLLTQLVDIRKILEEALEIANFPAYEELLFVVNGHISELHDNMITSSEQAILKFVNSEVEPVLDHLHQRFSKLRSVIETYRASLNQELHFVYRERQAFDDSVDKINRHMADYLDKKEIRAQEMFPHYYERYKTDGLEFNMYIGESISQHGGFSVLMVKNLRLWQMMVMIEMEREVHELRNDLEKDLEVASLILAYSTPIAINFRMDEKHFDVEGAYNARYEIVKKRIDKAYIKGTQERITAVRKLVIVFTRDEDEVEYLRYVSFLQSKGYLKPHTDEIVQVEDLQGVSGLRAIRAEIEYEQEQEEISLSDIMLEISEQK